MLLNHGTYQFCRTAGYQAGSGVYDVLYDGKYQGVVIRSAMARNRWLYVQAGRPHTTPVGAFETRREAADHLVSANSPSAAWLS